MFCFQKKYPYLNYLNIIVCMLTINFQKLNKQISNFSSKIVTQPISHFTFRGFKCMSQHLNQRNFCIYRTLQKCYCLSNHKLHFFFCHIYVGSPSFRAVSWKLLQPIQVAHPGFDKKILLYYLRRRVKVDMEVHNGTH